MKGTTRQLTLMAVLAAAALVIFVAEAQIPPVVPIPGVKLGLANIITLVAMYLLGRRAAGGVLAVRLILGSVFTGGMSAFLFSVCGGALAYALMCLLKGVFPPAKVWIVSILAAIAHNAGQLLAAIWVSGTPSLWVYGPALLAAGIVTGAFTGLAAAYLLKALQRWKS
jgi:heptaprenyl diphosphate synthase